MGSENTHNPCAINLLINNVCRWQIKCCLNNDFLLDLGSITYQCNGIQLQLLTTFTITDYIMITQIFNVINYNYFSIVIMITCDYILVCALIWHNCSRYSQLLRLLITLWLHKFYNVISYNYNYFSIVIMITLWLHVITFWFVHWYGIIAVNISY